MKDLKRVLNLVASHEVIFEQNGEFFEKLFD